MSDEPIIAATDAPEVPPAVPSAALPGALLAAQRVETGLSVEQVASQLKLSPRQIHAVESDNYAALPGMSITKGFIRAYAKLLTMEPGPLLALLPVEESMVNRVLPVKQELSTPFSHAKLRSNGKPGKTPVLTLLLGGMLLVGGGLLAAQYLGILPVWREVNQAQKDKEPLAESHQELPSPASLNLPEKQQATPSAQERPENFASQPERRTVSNTAAEGGPTAEGPAARPTSGQSGPELKTSAQTAAKAEQSEAPSDVAAGENSLVLRLKEDSWVDIKRANGSAMISRVVKAGSTETFDIKEPVTMVIGNVRGVDATLRGEPLEMKADKGNTIRLHLK